KLWRRAMSTLTPDPNSGLCERKPGEAEEPLPLKVPPIIQEAQQAFQRDLATLLRERPGQWVAYHRDAIIGFGKTKTELYRQCLQKHRRGEFMVRAIRPRLGRAMVGPG